MQAQIPQCYMILTAKYVRCEGLTGYEPIDFVDGRLHNVFFVVMAIELNSQVPDI